MAKFYALTGFYKFLFLYLEPVSTVSPAIMIWTYPGATWFHQGLVPSSSSSVFSGPLDSRTSLAIWHLGNCYLLLGLLSSIVFRAIRSALPNDPIAQERIVGSVLTALAIADVTHILATIAGLPSDVLNPLSWNSVTHGNITFTIVLFLTRMSWFLGIGRKTYYYGKTQPTKKGKVL